MSYQIIRSDSDIKQSIASKTADRKNTDSLNGEDQKIKKISKKQLINKINYLNFQDEAIIINLRHKKYNHIISYQAMPEPCLGEELSCVWVNPSEVTDKIKTYEFDTIQIKNNNLDLSIKLELLELNTTSIRFRIPDIYFLANVEKAYRYKCKNIKAQLLQNSVVFEGILIDFCSTSFSINVEVKPPQTFQWINSTSTVHIILSNKKVLLYSGECSIVEETSEDNSIFFLLKPVKFELPRFKPKKFRSIREELLPSPNVVFKHPLTDKWHDLKIINLSGSGFLIEESENAAVLIPGLILPEIEMQFASSFKIKFSAQVVYQNKFKTEQNTVLIKSGVVIIDITLNSHKNLMGFLHQIKDENMFIGDTKKLDELWDFFFQSGFIYPQKFHHIQRHKNSIKETYEKLYTQNPDIIRHFICKSNGQIKAHMSSIRFYQNSWLIHHHAARKSSFKTGGISVLNQIGRFINDSHRLHSAKMNYVFCYFRDNNKFPNRVFGGAARNIKNPSACSLDSFAYLEFKSAPTANKIPWTWELTETEKEDLSELYAFYKYRSGGLMLKALNLFPINGSINELSYKFNEIGLRRERYLFSLKKEKVLKAVVMINVSDFGLNLSDLTNSITVFIIDDEGLPYNIISTVNSLMSEKLSMGDIPIMIYPVEYLNLQNVSFDKIYNLWVLSSDYTDNYFRYLKRLLKFIQH